MSASSAFPCALCGSTAHNYLFTRQSVRVLGCANCRLARLDAAAASPTANGPSFRTPATTATDTRTAEDCAAALVQRGARPGMLSVVAGDHPFGAAAAARGLTTAARLDMNQLERDGLPPGRFESAVVIGELEKASNPVAALERIRYCIAPEGLLLVATSLLDNRPTRTLRGQWTDGVPDRRYYFDLQTIQSVCLRSGFAELEWVEGRPGATFVMTARRIEPPSRPLLSVVIPVFNERATFQRTLEKVLAKECAGVDKEIVIVESRSTDGTRELVSEYQGRPGINVVFEDRPRGKGAAVRVGLQRATGTIVLIQDADDEYDVDDYDALLEPILTYQRAFVLGSRHLGSWKVRNFANQPAVSAFFNFGHVIFRTAFNLMYRQDVRDPFTMYKVFRRDCLHRLKFECNRFDFDFELVIKLVRKGYIPLEVPVNYTSRSFKDGKKVSALRDPLTWIRALAKYRFGSIFES